jgi:hypothetical protein
MANPSKTDITTTCLKCKGIMNIKMVSTSPSDHMVMIHSFECQKCHSTATFPFPRKNQKK